MAYCAVLYSYIITLPGNQHAYNYFSKINSEKTAEQVRSLWPVDMFDHASLFRTSDRKHFANFLKQKSP